MRNHPRPVDREKVETYHVKELHVCPHMHGLKSARERCRSIQVESGTSVGALCVRDGTAWHPGLPHARVLFLLLLPSSLGLRLPLPPPKTSAPPPPPQVITHAPPTFCLLSPHIIPALSSLPYSLAFKLLQ